MNEIEFKYQRWIKEVWNGGNENALDELFDRDGLAFYPYFVKGEDPIRGIDEFKKFYRRARKEFSDIKVKLSDMISEGNIITAVCSISANRHDLGEDGLTITTPVKVDSLCRITFREGKIIEIWNNVDVSDKTKTIPILKLENN